MENDMERNVTAYALDFDDVRTYLWASLFVVCNLALPRLCHLMPQGGIVFAPLSFVILAGACRLGWKPALLAAAVSPLAGHLLWGMPAWEVLPLMTLKLCVLAAVAGLALHRAASVSLGWLVGIVLVSELLGGAVEWLLTGGLAATVCDFTIGWPGLLLQVVGSWLLARGLGTH